MRSLVILLLHCFYLPATNFYGTIKKIAENASQIEIANINCSIPCNIAALYCDTIAVLENKRYAQTCELPFLKLSDTETNELLSDFSSEETYNNIYMKNV